MSDQNGDGEAVDLPSYTVPDQTDDTIDNEEAELIDFKTLTWWYERPMALVYRT
jgi:hypothetical protein